MLRIREVDTINLKVVWKEMMDISKENFLSVKAFPPGSLGKTMDYIKDKDTFQVGSLSIKLKIDDRSISVLMFASGKIKVSGGFNKLSSYAFETDSLLEQYMLSTILWPSLRICITNHNFSIDDITIVNKMLNAISTRPTPIGKESYGKFIDRLYSYFESAQIILPKIMQQNGKRRGRICATKVKNITRKGCFLVDHGGKAQFFAYSSLEHITEHVVQLSLVWD
jgi:hypothetical protein